MYADVPHRHTGSSNPSPRGRVAHVWRWIKLRDKKKNKEQVITDDYIVIKSRIANIKFHKWSKEPTSSFV